SHRLALHRRWDGGGEAVVRPGARRHREQPACHDAARRRLRRGRLDRRGWVGQGLGRGRRRAYRRRPRPLPCAGGGGRMIRHTYEEPDPEQEAYDKGRRDERERIVGVLQEMYARHHQMARQERDKWVRMAYYEQTRAIEEAIRRIEEDGAPGRG